MPVMLTKEMMNSYLEDKLPYEDLFHKVEKENVPLEFYPVGDLVNKLSNQGSDNILHKEEIKYDKNKNWKLTCFFSNKNDENSNKKPSVITTVKKDKINSITFTKQIVNPDCDDVSTQITEMNPRYYQGKRASRVEGNKKENVSKQKIKKNPLTLHYKKNVLEKFLIKK